MEDVVAIWIALEEFKATALITVLVTYLIKAPIIKFNLKFDKFCTR